MALNFDALPTDKPSNSTSVQPGKHNAVVFKTEMRISKTTNQEYLNVSFKCDDGGFVNENYFDSDKPFILYKLNRLLKACKVQLAGQGTLRDVAKVIMNKHVTIDVVLNDKGYGTLDYSDGNEGIYPMDEPTAPNVNLDDDVFAAIGDEVIVDEDF